MNATTPRNIVKTTEDEISKILYANGHGHSVYHPVLVEQLAKYVDDKFTKAREEHEALKATEDPVIKLYRFLSHAIDGGHLEMIEATSKAIKRLR